MTIALTQYCQKNCLFLRFRISYFEASDICSDTILSKNSLFLRFRVFWIKWRLLAQDIVNFLTNFFNMAPTNKAFKEGNSYEAAYPLKRTRCVKAHRPRKNFWKRALNLLRETLLCREKFVKICEFTFSTIACLTTERKCNSEDLEAIKTQLQEK